MHQIQSLLGISLKGLVNIFICDGYKGSAKERKGLSLAAAKDASFVLGQTRFHFNKSPTERSPRTMGSTSKAFTLIRLILKGTLKEEPEFSCFWETVESSPQPLYSDLHNRLFYWYESRCFKFTWSTIKAWSTKLKNRGCFPLMHSANCLLPSS